MYSISVSFFRIAFIFRRSLDSAKSLVLTVLFIIIHSLPRRALVRNGAWCILGPRYGTTTLWFLTGVLVAKCYHLLCGCLMFSRSDTCTRRNLQESKQTKIMSTRENDIYLEDQVERFDSFIEKRDWLGANSVINQLAGDGFTSEAIRLTRELISKQERTAFDIVGSQIDAINNGLRSREDVDLLLSAEEQ